MTKYGFRISFFFMLLLTSFVVYGHAAWPQKIKSKFDRIPYSISSFPQNSPNEEFPLLVVLHGAGEIAEDYYNLFSDSLHKERIMVLTPQWNQKPAIANRDLINLVDQVLEKYPVDKNRVYVAGVSVGAAVAQSLWVQYPDKWAGLVHLSFAFTEGWASRIPDNHYSPVLFIHGKNDPYYSYEKLLKEAYYLKGKDVNLKIKIDEDAGHSFQEDWVQLILDWIQER